MIRPHVRVWIAEHNPNKDVQNDLLAVSRRVDTILEGLSSEIQKEIENMFSGKLKSINNSDRIFDLLEEVIDKYQKTESVPYRIKREDTQPLLTWKKVLSVLIAISVLFVVFQILVVRPKVETHSTVTTITTSVPEQETEVKKYSPLFTIVFSVTIPILIGLLIWQSVKKIKGDFSSKEYEGVKLTKWEKIAFVLLGLSALYALFWIYLHSNPVSAKDSFSQSVPEIQLTPTYSFEIVKATPTAVGAEKECLVSDKYPGKVRRWCNLISTYAQRHGLPPNLVAAVILQESKGNPNAVSYSGAVGLMQVMPRDGIAASFFCANGPCFSNRPSSQELLDPEYNIKYGSRMLADLVAKQGSLREVLKSYGPMNVGYYYADTVLGIYQRYGGGK